MGALPEWFGEKPSLAPVAPYAAWWSGSVGPRLVRRALYRILEAICRLAEEDGGATQGGFLWAVHPGAKLLGFAALLLSVTLVHSFSALLLALSGCVLVALVTRTSPRLAWAWLGVPLFSAAVVLPASLGWISGGRPVLTLWDSVAVTDAGLIVASRFVLRSLTCVSLVLLLTATTGPGRLLCGLRSLRFPRDIVFLLGMVAHYAVVLLGAAEDIHLAKLSRTVRAGGLRGEQAWVAAGLGALHRRSRAMAEEVHLAMVSRGYRGEARLLGQPPARMADAVFLSACAALSSGLLLIG